MIRILKDGRTPIDGKDDNANCWEIWEQMASEIQLEKDGYVGYADRPPLPLRPKN